MVKKLFKHEFLAYARVMSVVYIILLTMAAAGRIIQLFENDSFAYATISAMSGATYGVSVVVALAFSFIFAIIRFYKNLFTAEGYLTFTLPVTTTQHIVVKAVTAVCVVLITILVVLLSGCIMFAGEMLVEIWKAIVYILQKVYGVIGYQTILFGIELLLMSLLILLSAFMLYYLFISIGQLAKKNRILAAVGAYFVYYLITQFLSTVFIITLSLMIDAEFFVNFLAWLEGFGLEHPYITAHSAIGICGVLAIVVIWVEFFVVKTIITKKLNLE